MRDKALVSINVKLARASEETSNQGSTETGPSGSTSNQAFSATEGSGGLTSDELLVLRGVAHISVQQQRNTEVDPEDSSQVPSIDIQVPIYPESRATTFPALTEITQYGQIPHDLPNTIPAVVNSNLFQDVMMAQLGGSIRRPSTSDGFIPLPQLLADSVRAGPFEISIAERPRFDEWMKFTNRDPSEPFPASGTTQMKSLGSTSDVPHHHSYHNTSSAALLYDESQWEASMLGINSSFVNKHGLQSYMQHMQTTDVDTIMPYPLSLTPSVEMGLLNSEESSNRGSNANFNRSEEANQLGLDAYLAAGGADALSSLDWDSFWQNPGLTGDDDVLGWLNGDQDQSRNLER